jgi:glycerol-3-phosphate acyltransferase PlsX
VVCDGFVGNIVLKTLESFFKGMAGWLKSEITKNPKRQLGAFLSKNAFRAIARRMDPDGRGGAPLLGLNGTIVKAHGSARERAIMNAIHLAAEAVKHRINDMIQAEVAEAAARLGEIKT